MNPPMPHIIHRLGIDLDLAKRPGEDYGLFMERLSLLGQELLPKVLEDTLSDLVPQGDYRRIGRLELELTVHTIDELSQALREQVPQLLRQAISEKKSSREWSSPEKFSAVELGPAAWLWHFLRHGTLPASAPRKLGLKTLREAGLELIEASYGWRERMRVLITQDEPVFRRLMGHFGSDWLWLLLRYYRSDANLPSSFSRWQAQMNYASVVRRGMSAQFRFWQTQLAAQQPNSVTETSMHPEQQRPVASPQEMTAEEQEALDKPFYIDDAGLILLHPFLPNLLQELELVRNGQIDAVDEAASVLYSLAWGESPQAEWQLVMPKLLLGFPLEQLVEVREVTPAQLKMGEEMIMAAIGHWSVLGSTSVAGFRESFLQRAGRVDRTEDGWSVLLEQRPYDMLMEQLPWQISFIKLPWMNEVIRTQR